MAGPLLLQAKQAQRSVLADYAGQSEYRNQGERVVAGEHLMQAVSDIFLGWQPAPLPGRSPADLYYIRQLRDWKYSADIEDMKAAAMTSYGRMCGWTLARAHARTGDRIAIAAYLGGSDKFDQAVAQIRRDLRRSERTRSRGTGRRCCLRTRASPNGHLSPPAGPDRRRNTDTSAVPPAKGADTPGLMARR